MTIRVRFTDPNGREVLADAEPGDNLLRVGQVAGLPLEGTCEEQMACSTCHVILAKDWFDRVPEPSEEEEDLLDLAMGACRTSRLSCQIDLTEALDGLEVRVPGEARDMRG